MQVNHEWNNRKTLRDSFYECYQEKKWLKPKSNLINHKHLIAFIFKILEEILNEVNSLPNNISWFFFNILSNFLECVVQLPSLDFVKSSSWYFHLWEMVAEFNKFSIDWIVSCFWIQKHILNEINMLLSNFMEFNFFLLTFLLEVFVEWVKILRRNYIVERVLLGFRKLLLFLLHNHGFKLIKLIK